MKIRSAFLLLAAMAAATLSMAQPLPAGVQKLADLHDGPAPLQRMDVYLPPAAHDAPMLVMVHGGSWRFGGKATAPVVDRKIEHRVRDQGFVLVGHSAGAHLVALVSASPTIARRQSMQPWLGTVVLDSAAIDTEALMQRRHLPLYDFAFGSDPDLWHAASPTAVLSPGVLPMLLVCSTRRPDDACGQSRAFAERVAAVGGRAALLPEDLTHLQIDAALGLPGPYTEAVDDFIRSLSPPRSP